MKTPSREKWLAKNKEAYAKVKLGIRQSAKEKLHDMGNFAKHADDDID